MTELLTAADVLERAADKLEKPGAWTQDHWAKTASGDATSYDHRGAVCWCTVGALKSVEESTPAYVGARDALARTLGLEELSQIFAWNDFPTRQQAEVVAKLREAAALARAEAQQ